MKTNSIYTYNIKTMKKDKKTFCSFRFPQEQLDYLRDKSKTKFTTVTQYIIDLIYQDMKNNTEKNNQM